MSPSVLILATAAALAISAPSIAAPEKPKTWDGLILVESKQMDSVYLLPNADFRAYSKVLIEPTEIAFAKNWLRDYNRSTASLSQRISDAEARRMLDDAAVRANEIFARAFQKAGYQLATGPGPDVIAIKPIVVNVRITAPEHMSSGRTDYFSEQAGDATLAIQAKDSITRQVLGLAVDHEIAGDFGSIPMRRTEASNKVDFEIIAENWAKIAARGLAKLQATSPISATGQPLP